MRRDGQGDQQEEAQGNPVAGQRHLRLRVPTGEQEVRLLWATAEAGTRARPLVRRWRFLLTLHFMTAEMLRMNIAQALLAA